MSHGSSFWITEITPMNKNFTQFNIEKVKLKSAFGKIN